MTINELQEQALRLPVDERLQLIDVLMRSLQPTSDSTAPAIKQRGLAASLIGLAKTDRPTPTDEDVKAMLDERRMQKYMQ